MHLHVVSFNVPFPADYGGVIDVYHRLCALSAAGVRLHLHCYTYGRAAAPELEKICDEVHYYQRETGWRHQWGMRPYIVASRCSAALLGRLRQDNHPILLEGLHDCWLLEQLADSGRKVFVRAHNVEHDYYNALADAEPSGWKRLFFRFEAAKLERYEPVLKKASAVLAISENDAEHFRQLGCRKVLLVPPSHGHGRVTAQPGRGGYALYHGNLSVPENKHAVHYLLQNIISQTDHDFVVAGRDPDEALQHTLAAYPHARLVANPSDTELKTLLRDAQVNLLYTDQATGVKLKLLNALYEGRHCLVNSTMVQGTGLASACCVADTPDALRQQLDRLMATDFTLADISHRQQVLGSASDQHSALLQLLD